MNKHVPSLKELKMQKLFKKEADNNLDQDSSSEDSIRRYILFG
jgi:hypothetical protein